MKKAFLAVAIALVTLAPGAYAEKTNEAIEQTALDYIEGWYEGNAERMERALHPNLAKRAVRTDPKTGKAALIDLTKEMMVNFTEKGGGKDIPADKRQIKVTILDVLEDTASVRIDSVKFTDYLHIVKWEGRWVILNVVWENK